MRRPSALLLGFLLVPAALGAQAYEDWYPNDIRPPAGTAYPCALTALPRALPGTPPGERAYINHTYTLVLRATQAKLVMLRALEEPDSAGAYLDYLQATGKALRLLRAEATPAGLAGFQADVVEALEIQVAFFQKAVAARPDGRTVEQVFAIPEGRTASFRLQRAFRRMTQRYPEWPPEMRDSVYHHLCALDLF